MTDAELAQAILHALAQNGPDTAVPLARLSKRLGQSASVLLRALSFMGESAWAGQRGPGWVRVWQEEGRWMVALTDTGWHAI